MTKRKSCAICLRPESTCLCQLVRSVANRIDVIILQHPLETHEAKNTARLLHLCLSRSQLYEGEVFSEDFFKQHQTAATYDVLLYPETPEEKSQGLMKPPRLDDEIIRSGGHMRPVRLWVLDATWRKSRKMLYLNPHLQTMPRLNLSDCPPSLYSIRKAQHEHQLSTLEATCYALRQLEQNQVDYTPVLTALSDFVAEQTSFLPPNTDRNRL